MLFIITDVGMAFLLTILAGLSTGIGSLIAFFIRKPKTSYLSFALGFSGGVMLYISFVELLPNGMEAIGEFWSIVILFSGMFFIGIMDFLLPEVENPHHIVDSECLEEEAKSCEDDDSENKSKLMKMGVVMALAIGIHNFPEGMATFGTALSDLNLGILTSIAIALHNIPEGISVSIPIYYATKNRKKAFLYSFLSGLAEPIGAAIGYLILRPFLNDQVIGGLLVFISGVMIYISLDEILPTAHHYGQGHIVIIGIVLGMIVMALSLLLF
ncbi:zinc transporter ZupT [Promethearchaeum syntrophicum]|uniref:Zinc transporter ZupT n=1 Tax=Promethearchaeum syntrophicum TaxID=2594042 RepID=A0A5B9DDW5_9ARCH|nr:zinc transporter ZupT [Candidatus Prometheoarchaeum syntrophicum]QEE17509.1 zinc transporter ZupT [Candidatus Prometheoarchaeum syntrophicum]